MKKIMINIKGRDWTFRLLNKKIYEKIHGTESEGITDKHNKNVDINKGCGLSPNTIRHELFHIFVTSSLIDSSDLSADQMEELGASIIGEHLNEIASLTDRILTVFLS